MALRRLNIDFEALARAMATQGSDEYDYYLDTHTGRIMRISTDVWNALEEGETIAGSLNAWQQEELHEAQAVFSDTQGRYVPIPEDLEWEVEEIMSDFVDTVHDTDLRSKLTSALEGRNAVRRFKDVLAHYPDEQQRWAALQHQSQQVHAARHMPCVCQRAAMVQRLDDMPVPSASAAGLSGFLRQPGPDGHGVSYRTP